MAKRKSGALKRRLVNRASGCLLGGGARLASILPASWADRLGIRLGRLARRVSKKHRLRTESNLTMCFPDWTDSQVRTTARAVFDHFGKTAMRFLRGAGMTDDQVLQSVNAIGLEYLDDALKLGKGAVFVTAHFGNWERLAHFLVAKGYKLNVIARDANDERVNELINSKRRQQGVDVFSRGSAARETLVRLRKNEMIGILPDQNTWELYVPFFGFPAGTVAGPAIFHIRTGAPIVFGFCFESQDGSYTLELDPYTPPVLTGDRGKDVETIMTDVNSRIERAVRNHPEQWLWMHDRWKAARQQGLLDV